MLTRRNLGVCAICAIAGFAAIATDEAAAQAPGGLKRTILAKTEYPDSKYATILVVVDIDAGAIVARHTHPGVESAYVVDGAFELSVHGQPARQVKAGDGFQVPAGVPHSARNGDKPAKVVATYVVEKDKPLASPAPE